MNDFWDILRGTTALNPFRDAILPCPGWTRFVSICGKPYYQRDLYDQGGIKHYCDMLQGADIPQTKRQASIAKARATRTRNDILRSSSVGRLLLVLERCAAFHANSKQRMDLLLGELRYACTLADACGVRYGWIREGFEQYALAFELSDGDIVFKTGEIRMPATAFPRRVSEYIPQVLVKAIEYTLNSSLEQAWKITFNDEAMTQAS